MEVFYFFYRTTKLIANETTENNTQAISYTLVSKLKRHIKTKELKFKFKVILKTRITICLFLNIN